MKKKWIKPYYYYQVFSATLISPPISSPPSSANSLSPYGASSLSSVESTWSSFPQYTWVQTLATYTPWDKPCLQGPTWCTSWPCWRKTLCFRDSGQFWTWGCSNLRLLIFIHQKERVNTFRLISALWDSSFSSLWAAELPSYANPAH